ncbi:pollen-specific leucine-rich repeat extensin-like protein 1 isoform X1 [Sinocyclocheilus rhinocerous]|uniref:pollen-specific leucine-rich repeat extensin-like protein 1 isoform X1 n=1 Tax=Sinocyclocheilus rhinocerous TaxID=307959 RepID=UPI0007BA5E6E|nr:PREDICTED: pollen-specific leucine-rich repeat extensin-like protein 1 isoform X1 [Sinocyclocheilus rhinocerous]
MSDPVGPGDTGQGYIAGYPPHPDQGQIHYPYPPESSGQPAVPPNPGFYPEYQNPVYPPAFGPGLPPAQPPQWNAPPTHYNPSAPVSQPSDRTSISMDILNSSNSGVKFDVNKGKSSGSNFL